MKPASKYLNIFVDEGRDLIAHLGQRVLRIEEAPSDGPALTSALRLVHTLKGSSKMVGLDNISRAAHAVEAIFKAWAEGSLAVSRQDTTRIFAALDGMAEVLVAVEEGRGEEALEMPVQFQDSFGPPAAPPERPEPPPPEPVFEASKAPREGLRIRGDRLDRLQELLEDLTVQKWNLLVGVGELRRHFTREKFSPGGAAPGVEAYGLRDFDEFSEGVYRMGGLLQELQLSVMDLRMVPLSRLFEEYRRLARDLSLQLGKEVHLTISGGETEVDRSLVEGVEAPLTHLLRNAIDHGVETPAERVAAGKPPTASITLTAYQKPSAVVIEVEDDGRGIDPEDLRLLAVERGFLTQEDAETLPEEELFYLLCRSGFTTRREASEISGRGIGLDAVKTRIERMRGSLSIASEKGRFSRFRLYLPQSLSIVRGIVARAADFSAVFPTFFVEKCVRADTRDILAAGGCLPFEGEYLQPVSLAAFFGKEPAPLTEGMPILVLNFRRRRMAVAVDRVEQEQEIVVKNLGAHLQHVSCVLGVTLLAHGEPAPIIDITELHERWNGIQHSCPQPMPREKRRLSVLVVDDAVTSRHVESTIIEEMGHSVIEARDGAEALRILEKYQFDLVVTDMEMPKIDGIELTRRLRRMDRCENLPVIMISAQSTDEAVDRGYEAGINAYLTKDRLSGPVLRRTLRNLFPES